MSKYAVNSNSNVWKTDSNHSAIPHHLAPRLGQEYRREINAKTKVVQNVTLCEKDWKAKLAKSAVILVFYLQNTFKRLKINRYG